MSPDHATQIVFDPHVSRAICCLLLALAAVGVALLIDEARRR